MEKHWRTGDLPLNVWFCSYNFALHSPFCCHDHRQLKLICPKIFRQIFRITHGVCVRRWAAGRHVKKITLKLTQCYWTLLYSDGRLLTWLDALSADDARKASMKMAHRATPIKQQCTVQWVEAIFCFSMIALSNTYRKVASSIPVYYSILNYFWGATKVHSFC